MDGGDQLTNRVAKWLREQGYPLEMRTAREFQAKGVSASPSWYYADVETGQQRETDVYARVRRGKYGEAGCVDVSLTIECKSPRDKPWVLFTGGATGMARTARRVQRFASPDRAWLREVASIDDLPLPLLDGYEPHGYALARAFGGNEDASFGAMMSAAKAAAGIRQWHLRAGGGRAVSELMRSVVLPVLVVDAPLLRCELDEDGNERLSQIDRGTVLWKYQLTPKHTPTTIITVVTPAAVPALADDLRTKADSLFTAAATALPAGTVDPEAGAVPSAVEASTDRP